MPAPSSLPIHLVLAHLAAAANIGRLARLARSTCLCSPQGMPVTVSSTTLIRRRPCSSFIVTATSAVIVTVTTRQVRVYK